MENINNSYIIYGIRRYPIPVALYGHDASQIIESVLGEIPNHDSILINGIEVDLDGDHPIYDNALVRIVPPLQTKG